MDDAMGGSLDLVWDGLELRGSLKMSMNGFVDTGRVSAEGLLGEGSRVEGDAGEAARFRKGLLDDRFW